MQVASIPMESLAEVLQLQMDTGGIARLVVTGSSMYPTFRHRKDVVYLTPVKRELKRGDLILYQRTSGQYILHRIVSRPKDGNFICSGDNQWQKEAVEASQVIALVDGFIRGGKQYRERHLGYRFWVGFWIFLFPLRRPILKVRRYLGRIRQKF